MALMKRTWDTKPTIHEVAAMNKAAGHYFFSRDTMRAFGDRMRDWDTSCIDGQVWVHHRRRDDWRKVNEDGTIGVKQSGKVFND